MLTQICQYLRNWFCHGAEDQYNGSFVIRDGILPLPFIDGVPYSVHAADGTLTNDGYIFAAKLEQGPYIRIIGSRFNDGVWKYEAGGVTGLTDEEFTGSIWVLSIPPAVVQLAADIDQWCKDNAGAINSPYSSESFGGYSYTIRTNYSAQSGSTQMSWQSVFGPQLSLWRKI